MPESQGYMAFLDLVFFKESKKIDTSFKNIVRYRLTLRYVLLWKTYLPNLLLYTILQTENAYTNQEQNRS